MSDSFDIHRFGLLLRHDVMLLRNPKARSLVSTCLFWPVGWFVMNLLAPSVNMLVADSRVTMYVDFTAFMMAYMSKEVYASANPEGKQYGYLLLPASRLEKVASMTLVYAVALPLALVALCMGIDSLLCLLPVGYKEPLSASSIPLWLVVTNTLAVAASGVVANLLFRKRKERRVLLFTTAVGLAFIVGTLLSYQVTTIAGLAAFALFVGVSYWRLGRVTC